MFLSDLSASSNGNLFGDLKKVNALKDYKVGSLIKVTTVGDEDVGKICFLISYTTNKFPEDYIPAVFDNFDTKHNSQDGYRYPISLVCTSGSEEYDEIRQMCYADAGVILCCFAVDSPESLENLRTRWIPEVRSFCKKNPLILVGLKYDLDLKIPLKEIKKARDEMGCYDMVLCSSKASINVQQVLDVALAAFQKYDTGEDVTTSKFLQLKAKLEMKKKKKVDVVKKVNSDVVHVKKPKKNEIIM